jgi:hypothetical protein
MDMYILSLPIVWCNPVKSFSSDVCHRNSSPDEMSICLAQENWEMRTSTHSVKLSKNEMPGCV